MDKELFIMECMDQLVDENASGMEQSEALRLCHIKLKEEINRK